MKCKIITGVCRIAKVTLLLLFSVLFAFTDRVGTFRPFQELKSEEVREVQVVHDYYGLIHIMSKTETEEFIALLNLVEHNEFGRDYDRMDAIGVGGEFILKFHDGRITSVRGLNVFGGDNYVFIDLKPYHDREGTSSRRLSSLHSEYCIKWYEGKEK